MNKYILLLIIISYTISSGLAFEANYGAGAVAFIGKITSTSCEISINNQTDSTVYLAPVSLDTLYHSSPTAYLKAQPFTITLSDCVAITHYQQPPSPHSVIKIYWSRAGMLNQSNPEDIGYLANGLADGAKNIALVLATDDANTISQHNKIIPSSLNQLLVTPQVIGNNKLLYTYYVGYVAEHPQQVTAGPIFSYAIYTVEYH